MTPTELYTRQIKKEADRLGFLFCGVSQATYLEKEAPRLEKWLNERLNGEMRYMDHHFDKRLDPRKLVDGAQSVITLGYNYFPSAGPADPTAPKIARYAYGEDYHRVVKDKIYTLLAYITETIGEVHGRVFVDSGPVMEKAWATQSGVGWTGKHTNLINHHVGSYFFLGELITDLVLVADQPTADHCGTCTRCIDACPTDAITQSYLLDASRCISYLTIELKSAIPEAFQPHLENWVFGCDICQEVCPWNKFSTPHHDPLLASSEAVNELDRSSWTEITHETFDRLFHKSPLTRAGFAKVKQSLGIVESQRRLTEKTDH